MNGRERRQNVDDGRTTNVVVDGRVFEEIFSAKTRLENLDPAASCTLEYSPK
jgi:hypothetical protein